MTEIDYINATNLTKLRAAVTLLRDIVITEHTPRLHVKYVTLIATIQDLEIDYARLVQVRG